MKTDQNRTEIQIQKIHQRTARKKRKIESRMIGFLSTLSFILVFGIGTILHAMQGGGAALVNAGYGSVLLRQGAGAYVLVGVAAFAAGTVVTIFCFWIQRKKREREEASFHSHNERGREVE